VGQRTSWSVRDRARLSGERTAGPRQGPALAAVSVMVVALLLAALLQPAVRAQRLGRVGLAAVTDTAPTPPDLFVAYAPLIDQGTTPGADTVQSFDTSGLGSLGSAQVGADPVAEAVSPDGATVYALNGSSDTLTPVDTLASPPQSEATISLPVNYSPSALAISPDGQDAYVTASPSFSDDGNPVLWEIALGGSSPGTLARTITLPVDSSPAGVAITPNGLEALVTDYSGGTVIPVKLSTGRVATPIGVGITPGSGSGPQGIGVSPDGTAAYVADSEDGSLSEVNLADNHVTAVPVETGYLPQYVTVSPDGSTVWVSEDNGTAPANAGFVVPVSVPSLTVGSPIGVGNDPNGVAISPDGTTVYVANETTSAGGGGSDEGSVSVVPTAGTGSVQTLFTHDDPAEVVVTPDEAPVASFTSTAAPAGQYTSFDASASYSLTSGGLTYSWSFGDGSATSTTTSPTTNHIYPLPGSYTVTLGVTDASGTSTQVVYTGQYVLNNGGPSAGATSTVTVPGAKVNRPPIAYVADSQSNQVTPVLAEPLQASAPNDAGAPITVGTHPDAIAVTPNGRAAYVVNFGSDDVTPIDTATDAAEPAGSWIPVGSEPDAIAISPDGDTAYVANSGNGTVSKIALSTGQVQATVTVGGSPSGIAISTDGTTAYVTDNNPGYENLIPIELSNDAVAPGIPVGTDPVAVAVTPDGKTAYVVDRGSNVVAGAVTPVDLTTSPPTAGASIAVGTDPDAVAISPGGDYAYVTNYGDGTISQIPLRGGTMSTLPAGADPAGVAVVPSGTATYVADDQPGGTAGASGPGSLSELSVPAAAATPAAIPVGTGPAAVAITPDQAPDASLSIVPAPATQASSFDASQSTFPSSPAASYTWNFGDGSSPVITTTPQTTHTYAVGGTFSASVTITDADGTSTAQAFTGQTVSLAGGPSAQASQTVSVPYLAPTVTGVSPGSGPAGDPATLIVSGTDLFGVTAVDVGGAPVTGWVVNGTGTQISNVIAPSASAGSVDVTVTNPEGTSATSPADVFTYLPTTPPPPGAPTITGLSVNRGPEAGGTGVTITGTDLTGATAVDFGQLAVGGYAVNSAGTQITAVSPKAPAAGTVDVTVTTPVATSAISTADVFTYVAPLPAAATPVVTSVTPASGPTSGLTTVTVTGVDLTSVTQVDFGTKAAESFHSQSATSLTAVSPAVSSAGTVDVTVVTLSGTTPVVPADAFTYEDGTTSAGPVVTSVTPASGPQSGGDTVVIAGSNFTQISPTGVDFGALSAQFTVNSAGTQITATSPDAGVAATVDVVVTNPLGSSTITPADTFTYQPDAEFAPSVATVSPQSGPQAGGTTVTLTGTGFDGATAVSFGSTAVTAFNEPGTGNTIVVVAPAAVDPGTVSLTVTNSYGTSPVSVADAYTYLPANPPTAGPQVTAVNPASGPVAGGTGVAITGTGLAGATAVAFGGVPASSFTVNGPGTGISAVAPSATAPGSTDVTVTVGGSTSPVVVDDVYTYLTGGGTAPAAPPAVTAVAPVSGPTTGGTLVTVTGSGFTGATAVDFGSVAGTGLAVGAGGKSLTVTTPPAPYAGPEAVTVVAPAGHSPVSAGALFTYVAGPSTYHALAAIRALDTRTAGGGGAFGPGVTRSLTLAGVDGVPVTASAVLVNLTVTDDTNATYDTLWPASDPRPGVSSLVASMGETVAHLVEVPLGADGAISIYNHAGSSHVVVDVEGYYSAGSGVAGRLVTVGPAVAFDTAAKGGGGPLGARVARAFTVTGLDRVPRTGVAAVVLDLTSSATTAASYASVYPAGTTRSLASSLNWEKGRAATNLVTVPIGRGGAIDIYNRNGSAEVSGVIRGYVTSARATATGHLATPVAPVVLLATTASGGGGPLGAGRVLALPVNGRDGVPTHATDAVLDITAIRPTAPSSLTAYPAGAGRPAIADLSWPRGQTSSDLVVVPIGVGGIVDLYNQLGEVGLTVSLEGYYTS
jgi:YVTN family beta-propeller protein